MNTTNALPFTIRNAALGDEAAIVSLLRELAVFEKLDADFSLTAARAAFDLTGSDSTLGCALLFAGEEAAGVAVWFWTYRSFRAERGLFVEDLYVRPQHRGRGLGKALLAYLAGLARARDGFLEWLVLDWNAPAIAFYESLGARPVTEWTRYRLEGDALARLAS